MSSLGITGKIVGGIGTGYSTPGPTSVNTVPESIQWDCRIGDLPFLLANSDQFPYKRETAPYRKDRVDTERNPGEQSLDSGFWLRSQSSWHFGSGLASAEPLEVSDAEAQFRYKISGGVDVWTPGQLTLLPATTQQYSSTGTGQLLIGVDTGVLHVDNTVVKYITTSSSTTVTWGGATFGITSITSDGANYYVANSVGIYKGTLPSGVGSLLWNTLNATMIRWVKSRLMCSVGLSLYELVGTGPTMPAPLYTHPSTNWTWSDISEGPQAIYASGYLGDQSMIYKIGVTSTPSTVTLDQPVIVVDMPRGEKVLSMYSYVGSYLVIGTSKGVRVALIQSDGSLSLGPLIVSAPSGSYDAVADGSFVYVTVGTDGQAGDRATQGGLYRIDLGENLNSNPLLFPSAPDLVAPFGTTGAVNQVTMAQGNLWFTVSGYGVCVPQGSLTTGWLETGRIRLGTVESKAWRDIRLLVDPSSAGYVKVYASTTDTSAPSTWTPVIEVAPGDPITTASLSAATASTPSSSIYLAFRLRYGSLESATPRMVGYQVKGVPAPVRSELVQVPLLCFDRETDAKNVGFGHDGSAWERFSQLKELEGTGSTVTFHDYTTGEQSEAYIEQVSLTRLTPPTKKQSGAGGIVQVLMRLV